jgi:hypothetical protein
LKCQKRLSTCHLSFVKKGNLCRGFKYHQTLQELLAPKNVEFFSKKGCYLGNKQSLKKKIMRITGIPAEALDGTALAQFTIEERMKWIQNRQTTRKEDKAYCLLGIFGVFMPVIYGEGDHAFSRLLRAIRKPSRGEKRFDIVILQADTSRTR